jgi:SAM-dependent methyltransferase
MDYDNLSFFYDNIYNENGRFAECVKTLVSKYNPLASSVLDLGCGTGNILFLFKNCDEIYGIDKNKNMLDIAKAKIGKGKFFKEDICDFLFSKKFDVILCIYDTINHILNFEGWKKVFIKSRMHLNDGGIFIFDCNTLKKLKDNSALLSYVKEFEENVFISTVSEKSEGIFNFNIKVFEHIAGSGYKLYEENIKETSFDVKTIKKELLKHFSKVFVFNEKLSLNPKEVGRLYFCCVA